MLKKVLLVSLISLAFQVSAYAHDEEKNSSSENLAQNTFTWGKSPNHVERDWKFIESEHFQIYYYQGFEKLALRNLKQAIEINPSLQQIAENDVDFARLKELPSFRMMTQKNDESDISFKTPND